MRATWQRVGAESVGTFALVLAGCGAIMVDARGAGLGTLGIALTFGLVIMVMVIATGHVSGAHLNPAVTVAFAALGRFPWRRVPAYVAGQALAGIAAAALLRWLLGPVADVGATVPTAGVSSSSAHEKLARRVELMWPKRRVCARPR